MFQTKSLSVTRNGVIALGFIAVLGHLVGIAADLYSGYVPSVNVALGPITSISLENIARLLEAKSLVQARVGHYLAIFFIPMGIAGIGQIFIALNPARNKLAVLFLALGTLGIVYATFYHGTLAFVIGALQGNSNLNISQELVAYFNSLSEPLGWVLLAADFIVSGLFVAIVLSRGTMFPRWTAAYNPISIQLGLNIILFLTPHPINQILWLTVFNASLAIWYAGTTIIILKTPS